MAGETSKSTLLTSVESGYLAPSRVSEGRVVKARDFKTVATTEAELADVIKFNLSVPSHGIHHEVFMKNDTLDGATSITFDIALYAKEDFKSETSGTVTEHSAGDLLGSSDLLVSDSDEAQTANLVWTALASNVAPENCNKAYWELLGYDFDPGADFHVAIVITAAAGTPAEGDVGLLVEYAI